MLGRILTTYKGSGRSLFRTAHPSPICCAHIFQTSPSRFTFSTTSIDVAPLSPSPVSSPSLPSESQSFEKIDPTPTPPSSASTETKFEPKSQNQNLQTATSNRRLKGLKYHLKIPEPLILLNLVGFRRVVIPQAVSVRGQLARRAKKGSIDPSEFIDEMNKLETKRILKIPQELYDSIQAKQRFGKFIRLPSFTPKSFRKLISAARAAISFFLVTGDRQKLAKAKRELKFLQEHYMLYFPDIAIRTNSLGKAFSAFSRKKTDSKRLMQIMKTGGVEAMITYGQDLGQDNDSFPLVRTEVPTGTYPPSVKRTTKSPNESISTQRELVGGNIEKVIGQVKDGVKMVEAQESVSEAAESVSRITSASSAETSKRVVGISSKNDTSTSTNEQSSREQTEQSRSDP